MRQAILILTLSLLSLPFQAQSLVKKNSTEVRPYLVDAPEIPAARIAERDDTALVVWVEAGSEHATGNIRGARLRRGILIDPIPLEIAHVESPNWRTSLRDVLFDGFDFLVFYVGTGNSFRVSSVSPGGDVAAVAGINVANLLPRAFATDGAGSTMLVGRSEQRFYAIEIRNDGVSFARANESTLETSSQPYVHAYDVEWDGERLLLSWIDAVTPCATLCEPRPAIIRNASLDSDGHLLGQETAFDIVDDYPVLLDLDAGGSRDRLLFAFVSQRGTEIGNGTIDRRGQLARYTSRRSPEVAGGQHLSTGDVLLVGSKEEELVSLQYSKGARLVIAKGVGATPLRITASGTEGYVLWVDETGLHVTRFALFSSPNSMM